MKINNKELIQSYILTTAKYDYSVYEKRILYRIIEMMQAYTKGIKLNGRYSITITRLEDWDISMPVMDLLKDEKDQNYTRVKEALLSLNKKVIEYEDERSWKAFNLIERPEVEKVEGFLSFRVSPTIAEAFLNFSKGYSKYELKTAMDFESVYAMRFYELLSEQQKPITYSLQKLKIMFRVEDKYKLNADFIRYVIQTAQKELNAKSPYSFEFKVNKTGKTITSITFYPVAQPQNRDMRLEEKQLKQQISPQWDLDKLVITYLQEHYFFTVKEIQNNLDLLKAASQKLDLLYELSLLRPKCETKGKPKGYLINTLKKMIA